MRQLEIEFFYPLTEQIPLALDYTDCDKPKLYTTGQLTGGISGSYLTSNDIGTTSWSVPNTIQFRPEPKSCGYWEFGEGFRFYNSKKPNWLNRKMTKIMFGMEWKDEGPVQ